MDWDTVKVHTWQKSLLQMQNKFTKLINTLGFFVFIIFEDLIFVFQSHSLSEIRKNALPS